MSAATTPFFTTHEVRCVTSPQERKQALSLLGKSARPANLLGANYVVTRHRFMPYPFVDGATANVMSVKHHTNGTQQDNGLLTVTSLDDFSKHLKITDKGVRFDTPARVVSLPDEGLRDNVYAAYRAQSGHGWDVYKMSANTFFNAATTTTEKQGEKVQSLFPLAKTKSATTLGLAAKPAEQKDVVAFLASASRKSAAGCPMRLRP